MASCSIKVICRFRPMNAREKQESLAASTAGAGGGGDERWSLKFLEAPAGVPSIVEMEHGKSHHVFPFDHVFDPEADQETIYNVSARTCIQDVLEGYNGTLFAYGQSGSGKTFTMFGPEKPFPDPLKGVIPRASEHIFDHIEADEGMSYAIKCSFLEIYKENIRDLLAPNTSTGINKENIYLKIRESPTKGVWVDGLTEEFATCEQDIDDLIALGDNARSVASTGMNQRSSRSHTMFVIAIEQKATDGSTKTGRLNLIDLAGSEKIAKTGATGDTLEEAKKINQSLSALGKCINALTSGKGHIPYRESKLTRILQESLGGNTKTTLIVTCSPHPYNADETVSTMQFGQRAKTIKNKVQVNKQLSVAELEAELKNTQKEYNSCKVYSTKLEKQIAWMRSTEYDPTKPLPADLVATKPVVTAASSLAHTKAKVEIDEVDLELVENDDSIFHRPLDSDDESEDGSEAIAIAETKLELQKLRDEIDMDVSLLKDEIQTLQVRIEDKKQQIEAQLADISKSDTALSGVKAELANVTQQSSNELAESLNEKKEKEGQYNRLQKEFQSLSEETAKLQSTLSESDENFLVLFTENETIRTILTAQLKELHTVNQSIAELTRRKEKLNHKALSGKAEYEMLGSGLDDLDKEVAALENRKLALETEHRAIQNNLATTKSKHQEIAQQVEQLTQQVTTAKSAMLRQRDLLSDAESHIHAWSKKYQDTVQDLHSKLSDAMQNEATLVEKWKGQSQILADIKLALTKSQESITTSEKELESFKTNLHSIREATKQAEESLANATEQNLLLEKNVLTLKAAAKVAELEKQQILKTQEDLQSSESSSGLLATLSRKLKRLQEEKANMENELRLIQQEENSYATHDANDKKLLAELEASWKTKENESTKLQVTLTKESAKLSTNTALVASQGITIKEQKEKLTQLKGTLRTTRDSAALLQHDFDRLKAKRDDLERQLLEKAKIREEAQYNAVEAARLREQMTQRRRITNRTPGKKGLLEAFHQKVDIESKRAGLKNTGSLFLQEAREEHARGTGTEQAPVSEPSAESAKEHLSPAKITMSPSRSRLTLARRQSLSVTDFDSVRIGGNKLTASEISMYEQMFSHYDKDQSGSIDASELKALLLELGREPTDSLMVTLMNELDKDGNGLVEFPEFLHGMDILNTLSTEENSPRQ